MTLIMFILTAAMLEHSIRRRIELDTPLGGRLVLVSSSFALLAIVGGIVGIFSIFAAQLLLILLMLYLLVTEKWIDAWEVKVWNLEKCLGVCLCGASAILAFAFAYVPAVQTHSNFEVLDFINNSIIQGRFFNDANAAATGNPQLGHFILGISNFSDDIGGTFFWVCILLSLPLLFNVAEHFTSRRAAFLATAAFACSPMFLHLASQPILAPLFCCFALGAVNALLLYQTQQRNIWLVCAGVLCGAACGVYHLGYLLLGLLAFGLLVSARNVKAPALFAGVTLLLAVPWLLRSYLLTGNPVHPYFQQWFASSVDGPVFSHFVLNPLLAGGIVEGAKNAIRYPWELVMQPQNLAAWPTNPGVFLVAFALPGIALGRTRVRLLALFALLGGAAVFAFSDSAHALAPFIALLCVVAAASLERFPQRTRKAMWGVAVVMVLTGLAMQAGMVYAERDVILGRVSKTEYLTARVPHYPVYPHINAHYNDGGTVLLLNPATWYLEVPTIYNPWALRRLATLDKAAQRDWLDSHNVAYFLVPENNLEPRGELGAVAVNMVELWRRDRALFQLAETFDYPRLDGPGVDRVRLYVRTAEPG